MALYRFFTGTAVSAKTQKHDVFLKPTVPGKKSNKASYILLAGEN